MFHSLCWQHFQPKRDGYDLLGGISIDFPYKKKESVLNDTEYSQLDSTPTKQKAALSVAETAVEESLSFMTLFYLPKQNLFFVFPKKNSNI